MFIFNVDDDGDNTVSVIRACETIVGSQIEEGEAENYQHRMK